MTVLIVAHRLSTVRNSDKIFYLEMGRILEEGTHDELVRKQGLYHQLTQSQELVEAAGAVVSGPDANLLNDLRQRSTSAASAVSKESHRSLSVESAPGSTSATTGGVVASVVAQLPSAEQLTDALAPSAEVVQAATDATVATVSFLAEGTATPDAGVGVNRALSNMSFGQENRSLLGEVEDSGEKPTEKEALEQLAAEQALTDEEKEKKRQKEVFI